MFVSLPRHIALSLFITLMYSDLHHSNQPQPGFPILFLFNFPLPLPSFLAPCLEALRTS